MPKLPSSSPAKMVSSTTSRDWDAERKAKSAKGLGLAYWNIDRRRVCVCVCVCVSILTPTLSHSETSRSAAFTHTTGRRTLNFTAMLIWLSG